MSTILKALRRLEQDRSAQGGRPLRQEVASAPQARPRRWPLLVAAVVCGIAAGPLALVLWSEILPKTGAPEAPSAPSLLSESVETLPLPEAPAPVVPEERVVEKLVAEAPAPVVPEKRVVERFVAEAPARRIVSSDVEMLQRPAPEARIAALPDEAPSRSAGPRPGSVRPRPAPAPTLFAARPQVSPAPAPTLPASAPPPTAVAAATHDRREIAAVPEPDSSADDARPGELRAAARSPLVPALRVERTEWHPSPQRRVAVVDLDGSGDPLRLHEGDVVGALVVGEIQPSAVTFYHDGIELNRRVGARP